MESTVRSVSSSTGVILCKTLFKTKTLNGLEKNAMEFNERPRTPRNLFYSQHSEKHYISSHPSFISTSNFGNKVHPKETTGLAIRKHQAIVWSAWTLATLPVPEIQSPGIPKYVLTSAMDDTNIDYIMGPEEAKQRFSEDVVDTDLKDSIRLQKKYKQIQRQIIRCNQDSKEAAIGRTL